MNTPKEIAEGIVSDHAKRGIMGWHSTQEAGERAVERLEASIAAAIQAERDVRPPKGHIVTDDGVVREVVCISRAGTASAIGKSWDGEMMTDIRVVGDCYSTRQAAEAAKKGAKK